MPKQAKRKEPPRVAYLYSRISTKGKKQLEGRGLPIQQRNGRSLCARKGWMIDESVRLVDEGKSGHFSTNLNPTAALGKFLQLVKGGGVRKGSVLVLDQLDRLTRADINPALGLISDITTAGVWIATVDPEAVYERLTYENSIPIIVELMRANSESVQKRRRSSDSWTAKRKEAREGKEIAVSNHPGWLRRTADGWQLIPKNVAAARRVFTMAKEGKGCSRIAATLNDQKVPYWGKSGHWSPGRVHEILTGRSCLGEWQPGHCPEGSHRARIPIGDPVPGFYPAIISEDDWLAAQASLARRRSQRGPAVRNLNLYSGLLTDPLNGCSFNATQMNDVYWLKSIVWQNKPGMKRGTVPTVEYTRAEMLLAHMVRIMPHARQDQNDDRLAALVRQQDDAKIRMAALQKAFAEGTGSETPEYLLGTMSTLNERLVGLRDEIQAERMRLSDRPAEAAGQMVSLYDLMVATPLEERNELRGRIRALVHDVINRIYLAIHHGPLLRRHPFRSLLIEIHYRNGTIQQGYSPPAIDVLGETMESENLFVWTIEPSEKPRKKVADPRPTPGMIVNSPPTSDKTLGPVVVDRPTFVPLLKDGVTGGRLSELMEQLWKTLVIDVRERVRAKYGTEEEIGARIEEELRNPDQRAKYERYLRNRSTLFEDGPHG